MMTRVVFPHIGKPPFRQIVPAHILNILQRSASNTGGVFSHLIERQLAHEEPNSVHRTYNHADYLRNRATMMQQWADLLDEWKKSFSNIAPIKPDVAA